MRERRIRGINNKPSPRATIPWWPFVANRIRQL
jgi:hypothetical protein